LAIQAERSGTIIFLEVPKQTLRPKSYTEERRKAVALEIKELTAEKLRRICDPGQFEFASTEELPELAGIIGQERATRAIDFGIDIPYHGYNIYALGPAGAGKTTTIQTFLERKARTEKVPDDWVYVNNFQDPYQPWAISLPPGGACVLRDETDEMLTSLQEEIPRAFESEEYDQHKARIGQELDEKRTDEFKRLEAFVNEQGFALLHTPMGLIFAPMIDGQPMSEEQYQALESDKKEALEKYRPILQKELEKATRHVRELEKEAKDRLRNLDKEIAAFTVDHFFEVLKEKYSQHEELVAYLDALRNDMVQKIDELRKAIQSPGEGAAEGETMPAFFASRLKSPFDRYRVNVIVDNGDTEGAPVIVETNPTYQNLVGRIEHRAEFGSLVTDFGMIRGGALHRANGGYLVLDAKAVLVSPLSWTALKRALRNKEIRIEEMAQQLSLVATVGLAPEPIPLDVKVVLIGDPQTYYLLYALDEEFQKLFKVKADFAVEMDWTSENLKKYALFIHDRCREENLRHFDNEAVAKVIEYSSTLVEDQEKLTTRFAHVADIVREASYWAGREGHDLVTAADVQKAIEERIYRSNQIEERIREQIKDGTIMVDTDGEAIGQVNGLSILSLGDYNFGKPSRITARTFLGQKGVINIEREAKLSGNIHDKGVLILSGYLGGKYAQEVPLSLSASICFEQSYSGVEGDSASSTELYALLSSLSGLPIKQSIAVTGSVNQQGEVQAIGGATKKIEGFFDVCKVQGLTGKQGVIIPEQNVKNLMLREDVVEAVHQGQFHIYPVRTIDEGITILTGVEAGERQADGTYPEGTVNHAVQNRLRELATKLKDFGKKEEEKQE
jgi:lon-related putative ATP-dependent protease